MRTVGDSGQAPVGPMSITRGARLYAANTGDNSISVYDLTYSLEPVEIQHFVMANTTGAVFSTVIDAPDSSEE